jgi:hypothetical protein
MVVKRKINNQSGIITEIVMVLIVVAVIVYLVFTRVKHAN